ncbi:Na+/H+ antiporter NhaA [Streptomyces fradiae]|uniref:Na+/H+ antiporter NhaA n=1 Tax=Streptomyces fradiae TaxID=1906 RepID=UPI0035135A05
MPSWPERRAIGLAVLAGIGFTVALLIGELAFPDPTETEHVNAAVPIGFLTAATLAAVLVRKATNSSCCAPLPARSSSSSHWLCQRGPR